MKTKNYLSVVACMKDEGPNLEEWLEFHKLVGVDHFYLYDNESSDNTKDILEPYIQAGEVSYFFTDMDQCQFACYYNALTAFRDQSAWMAFIDLDEFLFSPEGDLKENLKEFEAKAPGIAVNEVFFGSNGHLTRPEGLVVESYTKRQKDGDKHIKSICQPQFTVCPANNPHSFLYGGGAPVTENNEVCQGAFTETHSSNKFRIHHYYVKSYEEYERKLTRGRADVPRRHPEFRYTTGLGRRLEDSFKESNDVEDTILLKYVDELKERMNEKN